MKIGMLRKVVRALRGGKYKQITNALSYREGEYCVMGLIGKVTGCADEQYLCDKERLSRGMLREIGFSGRDQTRLIEDNDDNEVSFPDFAKWFVENCKRLTGKPYTAPKKKTRIPAVLRTGNETLDKVKNLKVTKKASAPSAEPKRMVEKN